ncbi:MAG: hypothetical protein WAO98_05945 [Alphaproteobacteria bacterium]
MANWLQKIILPVPSGQKNQTLPTVLKSRPIASPQQQTAPDKLPGASIIYGMAASALFVVALYFLLSGLWFTGFLVLLPAGCFLGFALYFLKSR